MKLIISYIKKHKKIFILSMLFLTLEALADLFQPMFMSYIVDIGVASNSIKLILIYGGIMLFVALIGAFSAVMRNYFSSKTSQTIGKEIRSDMYHNVESLSLENIDRLQPASIITRITNDVTQIQDFINSIMRMMIKAPITCISAIILIIIQVPAQAPILLVVIIIVSLLITLNIKFGYPKFDNVQKKLDKLNGVSREFLSSIRVVKAFNAEEKEIDKFDKSSIDLKNANTKALQTIAVFAPLINLTVNMAIVVMLWLSKSQNASEIGKLMASINYMTQVLFAVTMISNTINTAVRAVASSNRIKEVIDEVPVQTFKKDSLKLNIKGDISFKNVSFKYYNSSKNAISNINLDIKSGETIGIIGSTGSGKSTLINLIPRLYDATEGSILIDKENILDIDINVLRKSINVVPQKAMLFSGKIIDNLRWGKSNATLEEVKSAASIACASEFIDNMKDGYNTLLGQGGVNLSGGQKQRLSLARAIVGNPKILILDDCTSALDAETESIVLNNLRTIKGTTILLISQRISTVLKTDKILCLDNGKIEGFGTHQELIKNSKVYQEIYKSQIGGDINE